MAENSLRLQVPLAPALLENSMKKLEKALQPDYEDVVNSILNLRFKAFPQNSKIDR